MFYSEKRVSGFKITKNKPFKHYITSLQQKSLLIETTNRLLFATVWRFFYLVAFVPMSILSFGTWQQHLARELELAGTRVDIDQFYLYLIAFLDARVFHLL